MGAGAFGQFFANPTDLVKVQMQLDGKRIAAGHAPRYSGTLAAFTSIAKDGGLRGLWRGWLPSCQRAALVQLGDLTAYDAVKQALVRNTPLRKDQTVTHALSSLCAGAVAATLGTPAEVLKTRVMNQPTCPETGQGTLYKGAYDCLRQTVHNEGAAALYKGWLPTWARMAPWSMVFFLSFEKMRVMTGQGSF
jgi:solute carrier family 25 uncoupling protein 27